MFRCPPALWSAFGQAAREAGTNRAELLRAFIRWYIREKGARLPERPS